MFAERSGIQKLLFLKAALAGGGSAIERTAIGNPLTFSTDLSRPLKSLLIPFTPQQEGTGDPSPENIRSILPWDGLKVGQINGIVPDISNNSGMEKVNNQWQNSIADTKTRFDAYIQLFKGGTYIKDAGSKSITSSGIYSITFNVDDANCNRIVFLHSGSRDNLSVKFPFELPQGTYTISFNVVSANPSVVGGLAIKDIFLVAGADVQRTETDIVFPSAVYGGTLDVVSGVMTVTMIARVFNGSSDEQWGGSSGERQVFPIQWADVRGAQLDGKRVIACNMLKPSTNIGDNPSFGYIYNTTSEYNIRTHLVNEDITQAQFRALLAENPLVVVCPLVTPQEIQLTPAQITAIVGDNTIWSDADGIMTAMYLVSEAYAEDHPISGGLGSGLLGGGFGSGSEDPGEDPVEDPGQEEGPDPEEGEGE